MSSTSGSSATSAEQRFPTHGTEAGRAATDRTGRCDLGCQASAAAGEPRLTHRRARPSLTRKSTPEAPNTRMAPGSRRRRGAHAAARNGTIPTTHLNRHFTY